MQNFKLDLEAQNLIYESIKYAKSLKHIELDADHVLLCAHAKKLKKIGPEVLSKALESIKAKPKIIGHRRFQLSKGLLDMFSQIGRTQNQVGISDILKSIEAFYTKPKLDIEFFRFEEVDLNKPIEVDPEIAGFLYPLDTEAVDPVYFREKETRRILEIMSRRSKNTPILVGEAGVGKSAIVEALAQKIESKQVPDRFHSYRIYVLDHASIMSGTKFRGEFEGRLKKLIDFLQKYQDRVILFIDEIHMLMGAGQSGGEQAQDAANHLKPILARGKIKVIGATTEAEYTRYIAKDPAFERRFQILRVREFTSKQTLSLMRLLKTHFEDFHVVRISDDAIQSCVTLGEKYLKQRKFPDKAIDLLDEACAKLHVAIETAPQKLEYLTVKKERLEQELNLLAKDKKINQKEKQKIKVMLETTDKDLSKLQADWQLFKKTIQDLKETRAEKTSLTTEWVEKSLLPDFKEKHDKEIEETEKKLVQTLTRLSEKHSSFKREIFDWDIAEVVEAWTGIEANKLLDSPQSNLTNFTRFAKTKIYGQDHAIEKLMHRVKQTQFNLSQEKRPQAVLMFCGPSGVGKTELAKVTAEYLYGTPDKCIRFDMSEFSEQHSLARLLGSPPGYVGYENEGQLVKQVKIQQEGVLLFDEIEKAHPTLYNLFLQMFSEAHFTSSKGERWSIENFLVIMTSNLISYDTSKLSSSQILEELSGHFRPEFLNRLDDVVVFKPLEGAELLKILDQQIEKLNLALEKYELVVDLSPSLKAYLMKTSLTNPGPRDLIRFFENTIFTYVTDMLCQGKGAAGAWMLEFDGSKVFHLPLLKSNYYLASAAG